MSKPFLLIGVGTGGLRVIENVQRYYYEMTGKNKPENVEYLFLETDEAAEPELTALKNEIEKVPLDISQRDTIIDSLKKNPNIDPGWIPSTGLIMESGKGANGFSAFGRIGLWGGENLAKFIGSVKNALAKLGTHNNLTTEGSVIVYVTGALTGGTGSGTFIDVAYLIQNYLGVRTIQGLFLIPTSRDDRGRFNKEIRNTLTSLKALDFVNNKKEIKYKVTFPNMETLTMRTKPFELVQLISREYHNQDIPEIQEVEGLQKIAGLFIFLNTLSLHDKRYESLANAFAGDISSYSTFGLSAIQYPKSQLEEFVAVELAISLLRRWISDQRVYENGLESDISNHNAGKKYKASEELEKILNQAFDLLDGVDVAEGRKIVTDLKIKAQELNQGVIKHNEKSDYHFVIKLFSSNVTGNYYQVLKNNIDNSINMIIESIYDYISGNLQNHECLGVSLIELDGMIEGINQCRKYWQEELKLSGLPAKWEATLDKQANWIIENRHKLIGEENNVVSDRLKTTLDMLKIHLIANRLMDIRYAILNGITEDGRVLRSTHDLSKTLPTKPRINEMRLWMHEFLESKADFTFNSRRSRIMRDVKDETLPILRIYRNDNFETEAASIKREYERLRGKIPSKQSIIGDKMLWSYLTNSSSKPELTEKLYKDCISIFGQELRALGCVKDFDLIRHIEQNTDKYIRMSKKALSPLLRINRNNSSMFVDSNNIPILVMSTDEQTVNNVITAFREKNHLAFEGGRNKLSDHRLKNIVIFYVEKGKMQDGAYRTFEPLQDIFYLPEAIELYNTYINRAEQAGINLDKAQKIKISNPYRFGSPMLEEELKQQIPNK